ncbi:MAG: gliding motility-associated C-terminal domain-containing protein [Bacteroidetes bacterium]|nr:MAG: gliding motility-associated C-terminal domain-containing protein [Bacteroidota bacterium]
MHFLKHPLLLIGWLALSCTLFASHPPLPKGMAAPVDQNPQKLKLPMGFSPNGDGVNDLFRAEIEGVQALHITIFAPNGDLMYEARQVHFAWDGQSPEGGPAPEGIYTYAVWARFESGQEIQQNGSVTLVR